MMSMRSLVSLAVVVALGLGSRLGGSPIGLRQSLRRAAPRVLLPTAASPGTYWPLEDRAASSPSL